MASDQRLILVEHDLSEGRCDGLRGGRCRRETRQRRSCSSPFSQLISCPSLSLESPRVRALFLCLVGGIGGADLLQHGWRQGGDLADELLQVFALHWRSGELQLL